MDDRLDVVRLREHVEGAEGVDAVAGVEEAAEVACEGGGVAGDVGDVCGFEADDAADGFGLGAGPGRVEEDEVGAAESAGVAREPVADGGGFDARVGERRVGEVASGVPG